MLSSRSMPLSGSCNPDKAIPPLENPTARVSTWKRLVGLAVIHVSTFALLMRITEGRMRSPVVGYAALLLLGALCLVLTFSIASDWDEAAERERVVQATQERQAPQPAQGVLDAPGVASSQRLGEDVGGGKGDTGYDYRGIGAHG
jgi:hypothetical protein